MLLHLVRHGQPVVNPNLPAAQWELDPARVEAVETLREALPPTARTAVWYSSNERKAVETAHQLTTNEVTIVPELREAIRGPYLQDQADFIEAVTRGLQDETTAARQGWEPLDRTRQRVRQAVDTITAHKHGDVALVGHGTAWTLLIADILGKPIPPALPQMSMPDLLIIDLDLRSVVSPWGGWKGPSEDHTAGAGPRSPRRASGT